MSVSPFILETFFFYLLIFPIYTYYLLILLFLMPKQYPNHDYNRLFLIT